MPDNQVDTIVAATTPPGRGGVAVVRLSGPKVRDCIAHWWQPEKLQPRLMQLGRIVDQNGDCLDEGLWVYFQGPASYTGEDVLEFQGHGNPFVVDAIVEACCALGCRIAEPGEFTKRAFLNDRINLTQAEAVCDLIDAASRQASKMAMASLQGVFSDQVHALSDQMMHLRMLLEASLDFSDEDLEGVLPKNMSTLLSDLIDATDALQKRVAVGVQCQEGCSVALVGPPNVGKSSLFNALSGLDQAIVTPHAGTTRDLLQTSLSLFGLNLTLLDTAGLRTTEEFIEQEGIKRAQKAAEKADCIVLVLDASVHKEADAKAFCRDYLACTLDDPRLHLLLNKGDLLASDLEWIKPYQGYVVSAKTQAGLLKWGEALSAHFTDLQTGGEDAFLARRRHLQIMEEVHQGLLESEAKWQQHGALELLAEDIRLVQEHLGGITGQVTSDDVLGVIFSRFCIGK